MKNMTQGNVTKLIMAFAIPVLLGNVFQQFYTMADTMMVGQILGVNSLAAIGASAFAFPIWLLDFALVFPWVYPS